MSPISHKKKSGEFNMELRHGNLLIRRALPTDAAQLAAWWNDGAVMAHAGFPNGIGTDADTVEKQLLSDDTHRFIIESEGVSIGEMCWRETSPATAEIGIKICNPAYQNRGLGKTLLHHCVTKSNPSIFLSELECSALFVLILIFKPIRKRGCQSPFSFYVFLSPVLIKCI